MVFSEAAHAFADLIVNRGLAIPLDRLRQSPLVPRRRGRRHGTQIPRGQGVNRHQSLDQGSYLAPEEACGHGCGGFSCPLRRAALV
jgi:hypothetical protein